MKTLIIYNDIESPLEYLLLEGDYERFDGIMINSVKDHKYTKEFSDFFWTNEGELKHTLTEDKKLLQDKEWDKVAIVTFLP